MAFYLGVGFIIFYCMACYYDFLHAQNLTIYNDYLKEKNTKVLYPLPPNRGGDSAEKGGINIFSRNAPRILLSPKVGPAAYVSILLS